MTQALGAPRWIIHRTVVAPVPADANDPANPVSGVDTRGFERVAVYWHSLAAADTDTLTCRIMFIDDRLTAAGIPTNVWLKTSARTLRLRERTIVPCLGGRCFVRIDAFSNAAVPCSIMIAGDR